MASRSARMRRTLRIGGTIPAFIAVLATWGCSHTTAVSVPPPSQTGTVVDLAPAPPPATPPHGSLWHAEAALGDLFVDAKARRVGDIVTIQIVESSSATNQATTSTGRESSFGGQISNLFNLESKFPAAREAFNPFAKVDAQVASAFEGDGATTRSGKLNAYITARIVGVLPNGNLHIAGTREVTVNNERQIICLSGIIRPRDISPANVVLSTYISDAKIAYNGSGVINDRQRPGWMANLMETVWPF